VSSDQYLPCHYCDHYASEWIEYRGCLWAVRAPYGVRVAPGQPWTCLVCRKHGHPQEAPAAHDDQQQHQRTLIDHD